jgi:hypothetical protein
MFSSHNGQVSQGGRLLIAGSKFKTAGTLGIDVCLYPLAHTPGRLSIMKMCAAKHVFRRVVICSTFTLHEPTVFKISCILMRLAADDLRQVLRLFLDLACPKTFVASCAVFSSLARVNKAFGCAVHYISQQLKLELKLRVCKLFKFRNLYRSTFTDVFRNSAFSWAVLKCPTRRSAAATFS